MESTVMARHTCLVEQWAGHFGTPDERRIGKREVAFDEDLGNVVDQVADSLGTLPFMVEGAVGYAPGQNHTNGFVTLTMLVCEAAQSLVYALNEERLRVGHENATLLEKLSRFDETSDPAKGVMLHLERALSRGLVAVQHVDSCGVDGLFALGSLLVDVLDEAGRKAIIEALSGGASGDEIRGVLTTLLGEGQQDDG